MQIRSIRPILAVTAIIAGAGILAGGLALRPAFAVGGQTDASPYGSVHCNSGSPCQTYSNKGIGAGIEGVNTNTSAFSSGVIGSSTKNGNGVSGFGNAGAGINGTSTSGTGVSGSSTSSWGVYGYSSGGVGLQGQSVNNIGVEAFSSGPSPGLQSASSTGIAVEAISESGSAAVAALGSTGDALDATTNGGVAVYANNGGGNGSDIRGSYIGVVGRSDVFPLALTNQLGSNLFYVDSSGNVFYHGTLNNFAKIRDGNVATTYGTTAASPTVEDNGSARLVNGVATVQLDTTFAKSIDMRKAYTVMITPGGDTRGLYVASKSPNAFVVREMQGGRGSLNFDYHIYASTLGQAGARMTEMTPARATSLMPRVQAFTRQIPKPVDIKLRPH